MTLLIANINNDISLYSSAKSETPIGESYCKFYQTKLRQLVTQTRYRKEQDARIARQKQINNQSNDNRLSEQRLHKEYMNYIRERSKIQLQEALKTKNDDYGKPPDSISSDSNQTLTLSISSTNIPTSLDSLPKTILKTKQKPVSTKQQRIISAPIFCQKNINKSKIIPTIKIDHVDENLSRATNHSFTQVTSSSQNPRNNYYRHARQSILNTIMSHLDSYKSSDGSKCSTYQDINTKFSSSISPTVYRNFERIIA